MFSVNLAAQEYMPIEASMVSEELKSELDDKFKKYEILKIPHDRFMTQLEEFDGPQEMLLEMGAGDVIPLQLLPEHDLVHRQTVSTATKGKIDGYQSEVYPYKGYVKNGTAYARVTIAKDMFYVYIQGEGFNRFVEPLRYVIPGADPSLYLTYYGSDVNYPEGDFCASHHVGAKKKELDVPQKSSQVGDCYETELGMASDFSMFQKYNDVDGVIARNVGVMNNVQGNYDDEFADEIQFVIVEQYVSDCSTCDPWSSSTDVDVLLPDFRSWGPNGFSETHDIGHLWTDRDFDGSTIGYAYVGVVCTGSRYAILQDFSNNAGFLRVLTSHETGHNFDATHDASGSNTIMAPSVNSATAWSTASIADIEAHYLSRNCLATCAPPAPPISNFFANLTELCPGATTQFFDDSENNPTSWNWTFIGGNPSGSTLQNPLVTYDNPGSYNVSLQSTNGTGTDSETKTGYITVSDNGFELVLSDDFENDLDNWTVTNPDNSTTWETATIPGSNGNSTVAWIDNYDYNDGVGDIDGLESAVIDLTGRATATLELEYAYSRYNAQNSDRMRILVSVDGGTTFSNMIFNEQEDGSGNFATVPDNTAAFAPTNSSEWCIETTYGPNCISLDLGDFVDEEEVVIRIENVSDFGNNLYIDNVNVSASCQVLGPPLANFTSNLSSGCAPLVVNFQDLSTNNPDSWLWSFPGGTPSTSTEQNPVVTYNSAGVFAVTLQVTNDQGTNTASSSGYITVLDTPVPGFESDVDGTTVSFENTSFGGDSFDWDFGDNQNSSLENPIHVYAADGTYIVTLTVSNVCGTETITNTVEISNLPVANFSQNVTEGCATLEVQFTDASSANTDSYEWTFEGGIPATSTDQNPTVLYPERGVYDVTLVVSNEVGDDFNVMNDAVTVLDVPEASFDYVVDGNTVTFNNTTLYGESYLWEFGDGETSDELHPIHTYDNDENYSVTLTASNECGDVTYSGNVSVSNLPSAGFVASSSNGCAEFVVEFNNTSSPNVDSYLWTFEGGIPASSTEENPVVTYESAGTYDVQLVVTNEEGSDQLTIQDYITVGDLPVAQYSSSSDQLVYNFFNESIDGDTYLWDFGDGGTSGLENPTHVYENDGIYTVVLSVTNECGTDEFEFMINVVSSVVAGFSSNVTSGCADLTVQFSDNSTSNATDFEWSFPGGTPSTSTEENPEVTYNTAGTYSVSLVASNDGFMDEITQMNFIVVNDVPEVDFTYDFEDLTVQFSNMTTNADSYFWEFGDSGTSEEENPEHTYSQLGDYEVTLTATNECGEVIVIESISVSSLPTANFTASSTIGCTVAEIDFEDLSTSNADTWEWTFEGGVPSTSAEQNPTISYVNSGTFDVSLTVTNDSGSDTYSLEDYVTIEEFPMVDISEIITGNEVEFIAESSNTDEYKWTLQSTGDVVFGENPTFVFPADGVYVVVLEATNECGTLSTTKAVNITAFPDAEFSSDIQAGCAPATIVFEDKSADNPTSFMWTFEGGNPSQSTEENPTIIYDVSGIYTVELIVENGVGSDTIVKEEYIDLEVGPIADFDFVVMGVEVEFTNTSVGEGDITWLFGDGEMSNEEDPVYSYMSQGDYAVQLIIDKGGNCVDTIEQVVSILVDNVYDIEGVEFSLYPNPNSGQFSLSVEGVIGSNCSYSLLNIVGQEMERGNVNEEGVMQFDTDLLPGVYFMQIQANNRKGIIRFVIQ